MKKNLKLNKNTIATLNGSQMGVMKGGQVWVTHYPVQCDYTKEGPCQSVKRCTGVSENVCTGNNCNSGGFSDCPGDCE